MCGVGGGRGGERGVLFSLKTQPCFLWKSHSWCSIFNLTLLHSERPKLHGVLAVLSAIGLMNSSLSYSAGYKPVATVAWFSPHLLSKQSRFKPCCM